MSALALALPAQETEPAFAAIRGMLEEAVRARAAGEHEEARAIVRKAADACLELPGFAERNDAHDLLYEIGRAASAADDLPAANEAFQRVYDHRARTLPDDHPDLQRVRTYLGLTKRTRGDLAGARALLEKVLEISSRTLPDDHPDLQAARQNLAASKHEAGDLAGARALEEKVYEVRSRTLPDDHDDLQRARTNLALTKSALGDLVGARALQEKVFEVWTRTLPDEHPDLQRARSNLAITRYTLGDLAGARVLKEKVLEVQTRTLPNDHPELQRARTNLAATLKALGDLVGARALEEKAYEVYERTLPEDHPHLQTVRGNLAATRRALGDLDGARALSEKVFDVQSRKLPDDHPDLQGARQHLAIAKLVLGDLVGAHALFEKVVEVQSQNLPEDHPDLQRARNNLALTKEELGDLVGARSLQERVFEVWSRKLPDDHPDLQRARANLAITMQSLGELAGALELREKVLAVQSRRLADDHPDLQSARANLASTRKALGDLAGARSLQEKVHEVWSRTLPDGHPDLQAAGRNLAYTIFALGDEQGALRLARERSAAAVRRLDAWTLAPRERGALARKEQRGVDLLLTLAVGGGGSEARAQAAREALTLSQSLRGVEIRAARAGRRAREADPTRAAALGTALRTAAAAVSRAAAAPPGRGDSDARERRERLARAVDTKERLERELAALAAKAGHVVTAGAGPVELGAALPARSAAAAIVGFTEVSFPSEQPGRTVEQARLAALVLARDGTVTLCPLGARATIQELVTMLRTQVGAGGKHGPKLLEGEDPLAVQEALRARVLDPILAAAGDIDTLWLSLDEDLELVPLDALACSDAMPIGERIAVRTLVSLLDLLAPAGVDAASEPTLLAAGGLDYDAAGDASTAVIGDALTPPAEDTRSGRRSSFAALPRSMAEVRALDAFFERVFGTERAKIWSASQADKTALVAAAPKATFVHLATHGYFASESVGSAADSAASGVVTGLSPLALCGLALSGANLPPDPLGRHAGILTAEEILSLDLSRCYLVTLSACDTSLGVRRAGQGYASLRAALQGAGARFVLTSLWKVGDEATMALMVDFYRRLWLEKKEPHTALWEAKMAARGSGVAFRDWAGWVLTGK
jgi:CHAT domain-containing protein